MWGEQGHFTFIVKAAIFCLFGLSFILAVTLSFSLPLIFLALLVLPIVSYLSELSHQHQWHHCALSRVLKLVRTAAGPIWVHMLCLNMCPVGLSVLCVAQLNVLPRPVGIYLGPQTGGGGCRAGGGRPGCRHPPWAAHWEIFGEGLSLLGLPL